MVDHHIVGFNVAVHDSHAVTVVQSLAHVHVTQNKTHVKAWMDLWGAGKGRRVSTGTFSSSYM